MLQFEKVESQIVAHVGLVENVELLVVVVLGALVRLLVQDKRLKNYLAACEEVLVAVFWASLLRSLQQSQRCCVYHFLRIFCGRVRVLDLCVGVMAAWWWW